LIGADGKQVGVVSKDEALSMADDLKLDLVEISPNADPPVCKIMDYNKYVFQNNKRSTASKNKQKRVHIKKLRVRPGIEEGDYQVKLRNLTRFLKDGDKVEISVRFKGREMSHKELGLELIQRIRSDLQEHAEVEREPQLQDRQLIMILVPKK
jgi:translation initiation factor IF-3